ncbi:MAG TPA: hypothetical protein VIJ25_00275, partial [Methylococcales bacterium]
MLGNAQPWPSAVKQAEANAAAKLERYATHFWCSDQRSCGTFCDLSTSSYLALISGNLFMAVAAVYPYKCDDIVPVEISRNCIITG